MPEKTRKNLKKSPGEDETKRGQDETASLTTRELAEAAGVTVQYIGRLERAGVIEKSSYGRYAASELGKILAFRAGEPLPGEESPASLTQERTLLVRAQREKAELDLAERRGELQSRAETAADLVALATAIRNRLHDIEVIAEEIRDALTELSKAEAA
jgi:transcriptional regulator with XRE-family HTH domain